VQRNSPTTLKHVVPHLLLFMRPEENCLFFFSLDKPVLFYIFYTVKIAGGFYAAI